MPYRIYRERKLSIFKVIWTLLHLYCMYNVYFPPDRELELIQQPIVCGMVQAFFLINHFFNYSSMYNIMYMFDGFYMQFN